MTVESLLSLIEQVNAIDDTYRKEERMTTAELNIAPSGPPPVATRHDHQGVIVTKIERPVREVIANCRSL
jgi:hypothetical protein